MPEGVGAPFLLWLSAVQSQDWGRVLEMPLSPDSLVARLMLQECPTFTNYALGNMMLNSSNGAD